MTSPDLTERAPQLDGHSPSHAALTGLAKLGLVLRQHAWQEREQSGLTPTQGQILALVRARGRESVSLSDLARGLGVTAATASDAVSTLARKGLVAKVHAADDRRRLAVRLTAAGERLAERSGLWPDFLLETVEALAPDEQAAFLRGLTKMIHSLQERGRIPVARMCVSCRYFQPNVHPDPERPHHCAFVDAPFGDRELRLDCADHDVLPPAEAATVWAAFDQPRPASSRRSA
jgi:DNA-binding MarR family transcriptional regulator